MAETGAGEIVGFASGGPIRSETAELLGTEAEIFAIYLLDRVKRQGIGRRLMTGVFDHLGGQEAVGWRWAMARPVSFSSRQSC